MTQMSIETRLAAVDRAADKYFPTERDDQFLLRLNRLLARDRDGNPIASPRKDRGTGEAQGLFVIEAAGGGNTSLVKNGLKEHPLLQSNGEGHMPWIMLDAAPSPATTKALGLDILYKTGYRDVSNRETEQGIWKLLKHRLVLLNTVFVCIDEGHDLLGAASPFEIRNMQKRLKNLMQGEGAVSVILIGIGELQHLAAYDDQINRRYQKLAFDDISPVRDARLLKGILHTMCAEVAIDAPKEPDLIERLVHASRRRFGWFIKNTLRALEIAALAGASRLEKVHFAEDWAIQEDAEVGKNVFLSREWSKIDLSEKPLPPRSKKGC
ncbi:TniB family NTP-binding protein [Sulfitobacter sp. EhC04]|uniref:TniB family NTP-binding protein n=1 Tax=Sulfitobacter sp. EhC04 TaxID=1849168 RepID=UPI00083770E3|nr:TniB family NTP-binding protein [Sulfitobacter sp. EhC04]